MEKKDTNVLDWLQLRVLSCYSEALMLKEGKMPPPRMAIVYPTYVCNHRCWGCDYTEENKSKRSYSEQEFLSVIQQLHDIGVKSVEFCGGGEPTLNPHLTKALDLMVVLGLSFGFLTNGTNLTDELIERLVKHGSYCRISLESGSEETFNITKRPINKAASFSRVVENIKNLVRLRNERRAVTKLQISIKYSIDQMNYQDVVKAVELAERLHVDSIQFKMIRNMPTEIKEENIINNLMKTLEEVAIYKNSLRVLYDLRKSRLETKCWLSPLQVTIDPYGDVYICCYYRHRPHKKHCLGNMFSKSLRDIWYSDEHWEKINNIDTEECNRYDCRFHYYNKLMWDLVMEDIGQLHFV